VARQARGQVSPLKCVDAVEAAVRLPFEEAENRAGDVLELVAFRPVEGAAPRLLRERAAAKIAACRKTRRRGASSARR